MNESRSFPQFCAEVKARYRQRGPTDPKPEFPFCLDDGKGVRSTALDQVRTTLIGLVAILLAIASAITAIFTFGMPLQILGGITALAIVVWWWRARSQRQLGEAWAREAEAWPAALVMAHSSVHEPGPSVVPGVLLVDFGTSPDPARMQQAAQQAFALTEAEQVPASHAPVRDWLRFDMRRAHFDRMKLPRDLAGNDNCWLVSLRFDRAMMPNGYVDRSSWFVAARAGRNESAELLPHAYWTSAAG